MTVTVGIVVVRIIFVSRTVIRLLIVFGRSNQMTRKGKKPIGKMFAILCSLLLFLLLFVFSIFLLSCSH